MPVEKISVLFKNEIVEVFLKLEENIALKHIDIYYLSNNVFTKD